MSLDIPFNRTCEMAIIASNPLCRVQAALTTVELWALTWHSTFAPQSSRGMTRISARQRP